MVEGEGQAEAELDRGCRYDRPPPSSQGLSPPVPHVRADGSLRAGEIRQKEFSLTGKCEVRLSSPCRLWGEKKNWQEFPCREKTDECLQQRRQLQTDFGPAGRAGGGGSGASFDRFSPVVILFSSD